jgi:ribosomal-protein-alanine N-acetyltransferase
MSERFDIATDRLTLRPVRAADGDSLHALWVRPEVRKYLWDDEIIPRDKVDVVIAESARLFERERFGLWLAFERGGEALVGFTGYWHFRSAGEPELMFGLAPEWWGRGLAVEMAVAMIDYGLKRLGFETVVASTDAPNEASVHVMVRAGLRFRERAVIDGLETVFYELRSDEPAVS